MIDFRKILAKSIEHGGTTLVKHIHHVIASIEVMADYLGFDKNIAIEGAILHDIGKTSTIFQERLKGNNKDMLRKPFRHEIASIYFISLLNKKNHPQIIDMVIAHHKSILQDGRRLGILDLDDDWDDPFELHIKDWEIWSPTALEILNYFGWNTREIDRTEAKQNYDKILEYCNKKTIGWSKWKGLLVAADHYASAISENTQAQINRAFKKPKLSFYSRKNELYPLSHISANNEKKHTIVKAPTGAGKTDFLLRRCKGRLFYTLPFQASINAMYQRIKCDLSESNSDLDLRLLHSSSRVIINKSGNAEEKALQDKIGSSIKVLTPHQLACVVFGTRGYEAILLDLMDCDVILDEIHTYSGITKAIVMKIVEVLNHFNCRIHLGTATMPSRLYNNILKILGEENVYQIQLKQEVLSSFDRHIVYKMPSFEKTYTFIDDALKNNLKVLVVCNRVATAQSIYKSLQEKYAPTKKILIHSRFKRKDRAELENELINTFDSCDGPCIVVSTQVVEVSLDINFDLMITEAAPLDSLIQRFGRINRKRTLDTIGKYKNVYVIQPPATAKEAKPYELEILLESYKVLPDGELLEEKGLQPKIDHVFKDLENPLIEQSCIFKNGQFHLKELTHYPKSILLESLDIDSVSCITEADVDKYRQANAEERSCLEIPHRYWSVANKGLKSLDFGNYPFIIPDKAYSPEIGLIGEMVNQKYYDINNYFL